MKFRIVRRPTVRFRIDFGHESALGPGKITLLEHIARSGSLSKAARDLGMSYRRAWLLLDSLNASFVERVTIARMGGSSGGGTALTPFGRELIRVYRAFDTELQASAARSLRSLTAQVRKRKRAPTEAPAVRLSERKGKVEEQ